MNVLGAFLRRDVLVWSSYRLAMVWQAAGVVVVIAVAYAIGRTLASVPGIPSGQGETYFAFMLTGIAFTDAFSAGLTSFSRSIRDGQLSGTLEPLLLTPLATSQLVLGSSAFQLLLSFARCAAFIGIGAFAFGYWHRANPISAAIAVISGCLVFSCLGLLSAAFVLVFKQGDPIVVAYAAVNGILGGALFPVGVLPAWLHPVVQWLPLTHALTGVRLALDGASPAAVLGPTGGLWLLTAVLLPAAALAFSAALRRAKKEGSLVQY